MSGLLRQIFNKISNVSKSSANISIKELCIPTVLNFKSRFYSNAPTPYEIVDTNQDKLLTQDIIKKVNQTVLEGSQGRLFAVVHVAGKQFKITEGDLIIIEGSWPPNVGDKISLDKILLLGSTDFTLIGRPLIQSGLVNVHATVIEKTLSHTKTHFRKKRRKQYKRINFYRIQQTMLRINKMELVGELNNPPDVTGLEHRIL